MQLYLLYEIFAGWVQTMNINNLAFWRLSVPSMVIDEIQWAMNYTLLLRGCFWIYSSLTATCFPSCWLSTEFLASMYLIALIYMIVNEVEYWGSYPLLLPKTIQIGTKIYIYGWKSDFNQNLKLYGRNCTYNNGKKCSCSNNKTKYNNWAWLRFFLNYFLNWAPLY